MAGATYRSQSEVEAWIAAHGGPSQVSYDPATVPAPPLTDEERLTFRGEEALRKVTQHTWTAKNGDVLSVKENPGGDTDTAYVLENDKHGTTGTASNTPAAPPKELDRNRRHYVWYPNPGGPDAGGEYRDEGPAPQNAEEIAADTRAETLVQQAAARKLAQDTLEETKRQHNDTTAIAQGNLGVAQQNANRGDRTEARDAATQQRTTDISEAGLTGTYNGQKTLAQQTFDLNAKQNEALQKREDLKLDIDSHRLTAEDAAREYQQWYNINITAPLAQAQEARLRADTQLQTQKAMDQQNQFAATNEVSRNQVALGAGQNAADNEIKLLPYRIGPNFSSHMSDAINSVAQGSSAGVHFSGDDFTFKAPDLQKIAQKATAQALAHISPYAKSLISAPNMPDMPSFNFSGAPQLPGRYVPPPRAGTATGAGGGATGQEIAPPTMPDETA